ncbi:MAG: tripartite tricarboxylate transporter substrate binding protein, partial [Burkholderiales bacterium]|nr:tripartite tricarboxylate transporter substrate binding protein [Burkholderiales bacterium]
MKRLPALACMVLLLSCLGLAPFAALAADTGFPSRPVT